MFGKNKKGDVFSAIIHIARTNILDSIDGTLEKFLICNAKTRVVTIRSMYKSKILLDLFNYLRKRKIKIDSVYVNEAFHSVNNDDISITSHPKYFEKKIDEIYDGISLEMLMGPSIHNRMLPSSIIMNKKTGEILEMPVHLTSQARDLFSKVRINDLKINDHVKIQIYDIS